FFFFQAEDGIRDYKVTGVQTCALPIFKSVMSGAGSALMGIGSARGDNRARQAAEIAIASPLLEASMDGAHGVLLSIYGGSDLGRSEERRVGKEWRARGVRVRLGKGTRG